MSGRHRISGLASCSLISYTLQRQFASDAGIALMFKEFEVPKSYVFIMVLGPQVQYYGPRLQGQFKMEYAMLLQQAANNQDFPTLERYILGLGTPRLLQLLSSASNSLFRTVLLGQLSRITRQAQLDPSDQSLLGEHLLQHLQCLLAQQSSPIVRQQFRYLFASFVKTQCQPGEDLENMLKELNRVVDSDRDRRLMALEVFQTLVEVFQDEAKSKCKKQFQSFYLNRFMYEAHRQLTTCVGKEYVEEEWEWAWDQDAEAVLISLNLIKALVNYDFFGSKKHDPVDQFVQQRSPLLIPARPSRFQKYEEFEKLKDHDVLHILLFLHHSSENLQIRCLCIELLCDLSRIQIKFFRAQQVYTSYCEQIMDGLIGILQVMKLQDNDDYQHALCYGTNIMKTLTTFSPKKLSDQLIQSWAFNLIDFLQNHLLSRLIPTPRLFKPLFQFLIRLTGNLVQFRIKQQVENLMKEYTVCLERLSQNRANGVEIESCGILAVDLVLQVDPLSDLQLMEEYLEVFKHYEVCEDGGGYESPQERLWKVYQRGEYAMEKHKDSITKGKQSRKRQAQSTLAECFTKLKFFEHDSSINPLHIQNVHIYLMSKVFTSQNPIELIRQCAIPMVKILKKIIVAGHIAEKIIEDCVKCIYVENMDREDLYEMMVGSVEQYRGQSRKKQMMIAQTLCFMLVSDDILESFLSYLSPDLTLQLSNKLLKSILKHRLYGKFRKLLQRLLTQKYPLMLNQPIHPSLLISILDKILRIDCNNQQQTTNKTTLFGLLSPVMGECIGELVKENGLGRVKERDIGKLVGVVGKLGCFGEIAEKQVQGCCKDFRKGVRGVIWILAQVRKVQNEDGVVMFLKWVVSQQNQGILDGYESELCQILIKYLPGAKQIIISLIQSSPEYSAKLIPLCLEYINLQYIEFQELDESFLQILCSLRPQILQQLIKNTRFHKHLVDKIKIHLPFHEFEFEIKVLEDVKTLQASQNRRSIQTINNIQNFCEQQSKKLQDKRNSDKKRLSVSLSESLSQRLSDQNKDIVHDFQN